MEVSGLSPLSRPQGDPVPLHDYPRARHAASNPPPTDRVEVSARGRGLARVEAAVEGAADLRFGLVSRLRAAARDGSYEVDADAVARAMMRRGEQQ